MMRTLSITIGAIVILIAAFFGYKYFFTSDAVSDVLTVTEARPDLPGADIIAQLDRLPHDLDGSVFVNPAYRQLADGTVQLQEIPTGKANPFVPLFTKSSAKR